MAITKIMHMKECKGHNKARHLKNAICYILKPNKTEGGWLVGGNCGTAPEEVYRCMMETKEYFEKKGGRQGYHIVLSFPKGEVDAGKALNIMQEFAEEYLKDRYDMVYAVHTDAQHIHGHLIFNSIDRIEGRKYRYEKGDWEKYIQPITNKICQKYGLSYIIFNHPEKKTDWKNEREKLRSMLDEIILQATSLEDVVRLLRERGCKVREGVSEKHGVYYAIRRPDAGKAIRTYTLGPGYNVEEIRKRIRLKGVRVPPPVAFAPRAVRFQYHRWQKGSLSVYQIFFWRRIYLARRLYSNQELTKWEMERNRRELRSLQIQFVFLYENNIGSEKELESFLLQLDEQDQGCEDKLKELKSLFHNRWRKREGESDFSVYLKYKELKADYGESFLPERREMLLKQILELEEAYDMKEISCEYQKYQALRQEIWKNKKEILAQKRVAKKVQQRWNERQTERKEERKQWEAEAMKTR